MRAVKSCCSFNTMVLHTHNVVVSTINQMLCMAASDYTGVITLMRIDFRISSISIHLKETGYAIDAYWQHVAAGGIVCKKRPTIMSGHTDIACLNLWPTHSVAVMLLGSPKPTSTYKYVILRIPKPPTVYIYAPFGSPKPQPTYEYAPFGNPKPVSACKYGPFGNPKPLPTYQFIPFGNPYTVNNPK